MTPTPLRSRRFMHGIAAIAVISACAAAVGVAAPKHGATLLPGAVLTSASGFSISGSVSGLAPGVSSSGNLVLTVSNPFSVQISLASVTVSVSSVTATGSTSPALNCPGTDLSLNGTTFSGSPAAAKVTFSASQYSVAAATSATVPLTLELLPLSAGSELGNSCQNVTFGFSYSGTATYTATTSTTLSSSPNPSTYGSQAITLTATVTSSSGNTTTPTPTGTVVFYECTKPATLVTNSPASACTSSTALTTAEPLNSSGVASAVLGDTVLAAGSYPLFAVYAASDSTAYTASASTTVTQVVQAPAACVNPPTTGATTIITGVHLGNYTVANGTSLWLDGGTILGNVSVAPMGALAATGGGVLGNVTSTGGPISLQGTNVAGNVATSGGGLAMGPGALLLGNVSASGAGAICIVGKATGPITILGNVSAEGLATSATQDTFGFLVVLGNFVFEGNGAPVVIGAPSPSAGVGILGSLVVQSNTAAASVESDVVGGDLTVASNKGPVTIGGAGAGNAVAADIAVETNSGGGTLTGNTAGVLAP